MVGGQVVEAGVASSLRVKLSRAGVAAAALHLGVVVGVEEGRREVAGGHRCNFIFTISSLIQGLAEVLVHYPGDLAHVVGVEDHVPGKVLGRPLQLLLTIALPFLIFPS